MHKALYRVYRPKTFDQIIGQSHITKTLKSQLTSGSVSHVYLFCGTRGTGKTSCAKILAKAVNCTDLQDGEPCLKCENCVGIENENILDVMEIDAASNNGVDNIRDIKDEAQFAPVKCKFRVYIIDEVHMLSMSAFNALLKIMEEPPAHVKFILATTEVHKIPATILSRAQRFDFSRIPAAEISAHLQEIGKEYGFSITKGASDIIARVAEGSVRDALSLCDSTLSFSDKIDEDIVRERLSIVDKTYLYNIHESLQTGQFSDVAAIIDDIHASAKDISRLVLELISFYRDMLMVKTASGKKLPKLVVADDVKKLGKLADEMSVSTIVYYISSLLTLADNTKGDVKTMLELALIKLSTPSLDGSHSAIIKRIENLENGVQSTPPKKMKKPDIIPLVTEKKPVAPPVAKPQVKKPVVEAEDVVVDNEERIFENWGEVLEKLAKLNGPMYGALSSSTAYIKNKIILIDCENELFLELIRKNEQAKESVKQAIFLVEGKQYAIGPYKSKKKVVKEVDALDELISSASEQGVDITVKK